MIRSLLVTALVAFGLAGAGAVLSTGHGGGAEPRELAQAVGNREELVLARSSPGREIRLGGEPVQILLDRRGLGDILDGLREAGEAASLYLVLEDVQAQAPPGLPFEVFMTVASGPDAPPAAGEKVGDIFLFDLRPTQRSFDVTAAIGALRGAASPDAQLAVIIQPVSDPSARPESPLDLAGELEKAEVTLGGARLVAQ